MVAAWCGVFGSGSVDSELMLWQAPGTTHRLDRTSTSPLRLAVLKQTSQVRSTNQKGESKIHKNDTQPLISVSMHKK